MGCRACSQRTRWLQSFAAFLMIAFQNVPTYPTGDRATDYRDDTYRGNFVRGASGALAFDEMLVSPRVYGSHVQDPTVLLCAYVSRFPCVCLAVCLRPADIALIIFCRHLVVVFLLCSLAKRGEYSSTYFSDDECVSMCQVPGIVKHLRS